MIIMARILKKDKSRIRTIKQYQYVLMVKE